MTNPHRKERTFSHDYPPRGPRFTEERGHYDSYRPGETSLSREQPRRRSSTKDYSEPYSPSLKWESDEFKSRDRHKSMAFKTGYNLSETLPITPSDSRLEQRRSESISSIKLLGMAKPIPEIPLDDPSFHSKDNIKPRGADIDSSTMDIDDRSPTHLPQPSKVETLRIDLQAERFPDSPEDGRSHPTSKPASWSWIMLAL